MNKDKQSNLKVAHINTGDDRENLVNAIGAILDDSYETSATRREDERRRYDREWDVNQATAALKAVTGLCTVYSREAQDESLDCVGRSDMAALLSLISDRLEKSAQSAS